MDKSLLMPRFTIRTLLAILTICALVFVMIGTAYRGQIWAWGVTIGIVSLIITSLSHTAWYGIVWSLRRLPSLNPEYARSAAPIWPSPSAEEDSSAIRKEQVEDAPSA